MTILLLIKIRIYGQWRRIFILTGKVRRQEEVHKMKAKRIRVGEEGSMTQEEKMWGGKKKNH